MSGPESLYTVEDLFFEQVHNPYASIGYEVGLKTDAKVVFGYVARYEDRWRAELVGKPMCETVFGSRNDAAKWLIAQQPPPR